MFLQFCNSARTHLIFQVQTAGLSAIFLLSQFQSCQILLSFPFLKSNITHISLAPVPRCQIQIASAMFCTLKAFFDVAKFLALITRTGIGSFPPKQSSTLPRLSNYLNFAAILFSGLLRDAVLLFPEHGGPQRRPAPLGAVEDAPRTAPFPAPRRRRWSGGRRTGRLNRRSWRPWLWRHRSTGQPVA